MDEKQQVVEKQIMSETKKPLTEEEKKSNRFSFIVGILIGLAIIIIFVLLFH
jgi:hypothetical protein